MTIWCFLLIYQCIYQWWGQGQKSLKSLSKLDQNTLVESLRSYIQIHNFRLWSSREDCPWGRGKKLYIIKMSPKHTGTGVWDLIQDQIPIQWRHSIKLLALLISILNIFHPKHFYSRRIWQWETENNFSSWLVWFLWLYGKALSSFLFQDTTSQQT